MDENLKLVQEIMLKAIKVTTTQKQDVSFEFYPLTGTLTIAIYFKGKCGAGLTKTWNVNVKDPGYLDEVLKDLNSMDEDTKEAVNDDDFLGES